MNEEIPEVDVCVPVPGTDFIFEEGSIKITHPLEDYESLFDKRTLEAYQESVMTILDERQKSLETYDPEKVFNLLHKELESKLIDFELTHEMKVVLKFSLNEIDNKAIYIDFKDLTAVVLEVEDTKGGVNTYEISASTGDLSLIHI